MSNVTVLMYCNGNNELEPEVWSACYSILQMHRNHNATIIMQVAREDRKITNIIKNDSTPIIEQDWCGVRRYVLKEEQDSIEQITNVNMSDTKNLFDFVVWGQTNYPADKYCLILGGHVYQFIGISPDYTQKEPYLIGFPELAFSLQKAYEHTGCALDLLLLDTCYASTFETLCEFSRYKDPGVKNILTYIGAGPISGMPYGDIINKISSLYTQELSTFEVIKQLIIYLQNVDFPFPLVGLKIIHSILEECKQQFSSMAYKYLKNKDNFPKIETPFSILSSDSNCPWYSNIKELHLLSKELIIYHSTQPLFSNKNLPIHVLYTKIPDEHRRNLYARLYFACRNDWYNLLTDLPLTQGVQEYIPSCTTMQMSDMVLQAFITNSNNHISYPQQVKIKNNLACHNNWILNNDTTPVTLINRMTIAYILPHTNLTGGMKMLLQQMEKLKQKGHRVFAVLKSDKNIDHIEFDWIKLNVDKHIIIPINAPYAEYLKDCDVIVAGWINQLPELSQSGKPFLYWEQGHEWLFGDISPLYSKDAVNQMLDLCYNTPCKIYSVSSFVSQTIKNKFGIETDILPNGIDTTFYYPQKTKEKNMILLVGNPKLPFKGFDVALKSLNIVYKLGYDFHVKWVCQELPNTYNILFPIEYFIKPTQEDLAKLYRNSEIFVFSSWYEGFGMPPLEAMASGAAVVCTNCGGVSDYIVHGYNALVSKPGDVEELTLHIILLLKNKELQSVLSDNGLLTAEKFNFNIVIDKLEQNIYNIIDTL